MIFEHTFNALLAAFNAEKVEFMIVGGYAVNFHGYERNTSDLDIWVKPTAENIQRVGDALLRIGYAAEDVSQVKKLNHEKPFLFHVGHKPEDVEVFNFITGVSYAEAEVNKILFSDEVGLPVYFIGVKDLIVNKMMTGRLQDKADVEQLQKISQFKKP